MPRPRQFNREETLEKAMLVFWKKGYNGTSMQDLVDAMGINRSSMYDTFGEKKALFHEALSVYKSKFGINNYYLSFETPTLGLNTLINDYVNDVIADKEGKGCFILNSTAESPDDDRKLHQFVSGNFKEVHAVISELITSGQKAEEFMKDKSAEELTDQLIVGLQGLRMIALVLKDKNRLRRISENLMESVLL